jgi:hypothetical protein
MITEETKHPSPIYSFWLGKQVVLLVAIRQYYVPLPCSIVSETLAGVHICIHPGWEIDVRKDLILAVEEDRITPDTMVN